MFCRYCGKELAEHAVVCTQCGAWVKEEEKECREMPATENAAKAEKSEQRSKLFGVIAAACIAAAMSLIFAGIAKIGTTNSLWDEDFFMAAFLFSWAALAFGIVSFVFAMKSRKNAPVRYVSTLVFILSILAFISPAYFL